MLTTVPWSYDLRSVAAAFAELPCVDDGQDQLAYEGLAQRASALAEALLRAGLPPGEPVATCLRNGIPAVWASFGVTMAGAAEVPLNPALSAAERRYCLEIAGVRRVVTTLAEAPGFAALGCMVTTVEELADRAGDLSAVPPVPADAWGRILFTSGTTGRPKAIAHSHGARWVANLLQQASLPQKPGPGSRILLMTPYTHGASLLATAFLAHGATAVLLDGVDTGVVGRLLANGGIDHVFAPPTVLAKLVGAFAGRSFAGIRTVFTGTAPLTPALYAQARALFGPVVRVTYGKSEVVNPITVLPAAELDRYYREEAAGTDGVCVGWPANGVEVEIRNEDGSRCAMGAAGEVHLRARQMLAGHIDAAGFHPLPADGFHATGDLGRIDRRGRLHLVGRMADVIKSGGYKVSPQEIELALGESAGAVTVIGVPSEYWGEVIVAVAEGATADWPDRAREAAAGLTRYKQPRAYVSLPALPRNAQGKIPRARVRELVLERYRLADGPRPSLLPRS